MKFSTNILYGMILTMAPAVLLGMQRVADTSKLETQENIIAMPHEVLETKQLSPSAIMQKQWEEREKQTIIQQQEKLKSDSQLQLHDVAISPIQQVSMIPNYLGKLIQLLDAHPEISADIMDIQMAAIQAAKCHAIFRDNQKLSKQHISFFKDTLDKLVKAEITLRNEAVCTSFASDTIMLETLRAALPQLYLSLHDLLQRAMFDPRSTCIKIKSFFPEMYRGCKTLTKKDIQESLSFWSWSSGKAKSACEILQVINLLSLIGRTIGIDDVLHNAPTFYTFVALTGLDYAAWTSIVLGQYAQQSTRYPNSLVRQHTLTLLTYWLLEAWSIAIFYGK